jgi:hypothetical protein
MGARQTIDGEEGRHDQKRNSTKARNGIGKSDGALTPPYRMLNPSKNAPEPEGDGDGNG